MTSASEMLQRQCRILAPGTVAAMAVEHAIAPTTVRRIAAMLDLQHRPLRCGDGSATILVRDISRCNVTSAPTGIETGGSFSPRMGASRRVKIMGARFGPASRRDASPS
jgi:hypothetical protein